MDDVGVDLPEGLLDHIRAGRAALVVGADLADAAPLAKLPIPAVWTVGPVALDVLVAAFVAGSPPGWSEPRTDVLDARRRHVHSLVAAGAGARAARQAFADAPELRALVEVIYRRGALIFVGFAAGDPDLAILLERFLAGFAPPDGARHVFIGAAAPPAELLAEHGIVHLPAEPEELLAALARSSAASGLTLARVHPVADDLDGWVARADEDPTDAEARAAIEAMLGRARAAGKTDRVIEVLLAQVELAPAGTARAAMLVELAATFEKDVGDLPRAFTALAAAVKESPADPAPLASAERLADATDGWSTLVAELAEVVPQVTDLRLAAGLWARLARWYQDKLGHDDYAIASFREALKLDAGRGDALAGLETLYRKAQKWSELAEILGARAASEATPAPLLALAELYEGALGSPGRAAEAYERVVALDPTHEDALAALERLYRRGEIWGKLVAVLEKRLAIPGADAARVAAGRKELAQLRAEKLGDIEGAIARFRAALTADGRDLEALRALAGLYERLGRTEDHLNVLERLAEVGPENERSALLRRIAAETEDHEGGAPRAIRAYQRLLEREPGAAVAYRGLERLYRRTHDGEALVALWQRRVATTADAAARVELHAGLGRLFVEELADPRRAIEAYVQAVDLQPDHEPSLAALARLYERTESWDRALAVVEKHAEIVHGARAAELWHRAATLLETRLGDPAGAESRLGRALEAEPTHLPALLALVALAKKRADWARASSYLLEAEQATVNRAERVALLFEAAVLAEDRLDQPDVALEHLARVLAADPEHVEAGRRAADRWVAAESWVLAEPVLEMLARKTDPDDRIELARRHGQLGAAAAALGRLDKAARHYQAAVTADPDALPHALGQAEVHVARGEHAEADRAFREILARHRRALADEQVVVIWERIGAGARARADAASAEDAFRRALELDPGHRPSLAQLAELAGERGDWRAVIEARRDALEGASEEERVKLLEEIGDVHAGKLAERPAAIGIYLEGLALRPRSPRLLHRLLGLHTEEKEWRRAVEVLDRIAEIERDPAVRAKVANAAALIARDELGAADEAVQRFGRVLDDAPEREDAFEAIEELLADSQDWAGLAAELQAMIRRLGDRATDAQLLRLWTRLGDVAAEKLGDRDAALAAYEVAAALEPGDLGRHEQLAELYLAAGPAAADKAAAELQLLLKKAPDRLDLYQRLHELYLETGQRDRSFCLAQALVFLGHAGPEEMRELEAGRPAQVDRARRRLTEELWQKAVLHPREDRVLSGIFGLLSGALAATTAQSHGTLGLGPKEQVRGDDPHAAARLFRYAAGLLGLAPPPELYFKPRAESGIQAANVAEKGALCPAVLVGEPHLSRAGEGETAFVLGKKLAYFRPERYVFFALPNLPRLEAALAAALVATGVSPPTKEPDVDKLASHLTRTVPPPVLEHVAALARKHAAAGGGAAVASSIAGWVVATDLTANRVGLIVANDLETAARAIATERGVPTTMPAKERLRDLLAYAASEEYFAVRRHLGLEVAS